MQFKFAATAIAVAMIFVGGCAAEPDDTDVKRGSLGKADVWGSCAADDCGGHASSGNCWCDDLCDGYGDCCSDEADFCQ